MKQYLDIVNTILTHGVESTDRTGVGTLRIFGMQTRWNLAEGFPATTSKQLFFKPCKHELQWFLSGNVDRRKLQEMTFGDFDEERFDIWRGNCLDMKNKNPNRFNGYNLGNMYPMAWRFAPCNPHGYHWIERKKPIDDSSYVDTHVCPDIVEAHRYTGKIIESTCSGKYEIIGKSRNGVVIKFIETGSFREIPRPIKTIKDLFKPTVEGFGYLGMEIPNNPTAKKLYQVWKDMIIRVHNPRENHSSYKGVTICKRWYNFANFYNDAFSLWGFQEWVDSGYQWEIDKDYYGTMHYSPETVLFLAPGWSKSLNGGGYGFKVYIHNGNVFYSRSDLQKSRGLTERANFPDDLEILQDNATHVVRPIIWVDQIQKVVDVLKSNPDSRNIVVDAWNPRGTENSVLGICHPMTQFVVINGKLSLQWYQRSVDVFLGLPFNIASYALLTHIIADICGYEVGDLVWSGGDVHIYKNAVEQAKELLKPERAPLPLPTLVMPKVNSLLDLDQEFFDSIHLKDYNHHGSLKAAMAV